MRIGVLGSGDVGRVLATGFVKHGHEVMIGSRDPKQEKLQAWVKAAGPTGSAGTFAETAGFGEVAVLATAWSGTETALALAGPEHFDGKVVIDATNPLAFSQGAPPKLAVHGNDSAGETVQRRLPGARVVKAFNIVGNQHMIHPDFPGGPPDMFICGDDDTAKGTVADLLTSFGWRVIDVGVISSSRYLEAMAMVWILHFFKTGSGNHAFKMLSK
jgi:8-hydroxy-5-deazaflavin:NADPH oxidoreductase